MNYRTSVSPQALLRMGRIARRLCGVTYPVDLVSPFTWELPKEVDEPTPKYHFRVTGLESWNEDHWIYYQWLFHPKWRIIAPQGRHLSYRIRCLLSHLDVPLRPIDCRKDFRLFRALFDPIHVQQSATAFLTSIKLIEGLSAIEECIHGKAFRASKRPSQGWSGRLHALAGAEGPR